MSRSLAKIFKKLKRQAHRAMPIPVTLTAPNEELCNNIKDFCSDRIKTLNTTTSSNTADLLARIKHANTLADEAATTDKEKAIIEEYSLWIMESFLAHLKNKYRNQVENETIEPESSSSILPNFIRKPLFLLLTTIGISMDGMGSFLFAESLLALIPGITNPWLLAISGVFTLVNSALFYSFEASMLKKALGIKDVNNTEKILQAYDQQRKTTAQVNKLLLNINTLAPVVEFKAYSKVANALNEKTLAIKNKIPQDLEKGYLKWLRRGVTAFGAIMAIAGGYFTAASLLTVLAAGLLVTPAGWVIVSLSMASSLAFFMAMRASGMFQMGGKALQTAKALKTKLDKFKNEYEGHEFKFDAAYTSRLKNKAYEIKARKEAYERKAQKEAKITAGATQETLPTSKWRKKASGHRQDAIPSAATPSFTPASIGI